MIAPTGPGWWWKRAPSGGARIVEITLRKKEFGGECTPHYKTGIYWLEVENDGSWIAPVVPLDQTPMPGKAGEP